MSAWMTSSSNRLRLKQNRIFGEQETKSATNTSVIFPTKPAINARHLQGRAIPRGSVEGNTQISNHLKSNRPGESTTSEYETNKMKHLNLGDSAADARLMIQHSSNQNQSKVESELQVLHQHKLFLLQQQQKQESDYLKAVALRSCLGSTPNQEAFLGLDPFNNVGIGAAALGIDPMKLEMQRYKVAKLHDELQLREHLHLQEQLIQRRQQEEEIAMAASRQQLQRRKLVSNMHHDFDEVTMMNERFPIQHQRISNFPHGDIPGVTSLFDGQILFRDGRPVSARPPLGHACPVQLPLRNLSPPGIAKLHSCPSTSIPAFNNSSSSNDNHMKRKIPHNLTTPLAAPLASASLSKHPLDHDRMLTKEFLFQEEQARKEENAARLEHALLQQHALRQKQTVFMNHIEGIRNRDLAIFEEQVRKEEIEHAQRREALLLDMHKHEEVIRIHNQTKFQNLTRKGGGNGNLFPDSSKEVKSLKASQDPTKLNESDLAPPLKQLLQKSFSSVPEIKVPQIRLEDTEYDETIEKKKLNNLNKPEPDITDSISSQLRFFNNGVEVNVSGTPISSKESDISMKNDLIKMKLSEEAHNAKKRCYNVSINDLISYLIHRVPEAEKSLSCVQRKLANENIENMDLALVDQITQELQLLLHNQHDSGYSKQERAFSKQNLRKRVLDCVKEVEAFKLGIPSALANLDGETYAPRPKKCPSTSFSKKVSNRRKRNDEQVNKEEIKKRKISKLEIQNNGDKVSKRKTKKRPINMKNLDEATPCPSSSKLSSKLHTMTLEISAEKKIRVQTALDPLSDPEEVYSASENTITNPTFTNEVESNPKVGREKLKKEKENSTKEQEKTLSAANVLLDFMRKRGN